MEGIRERPGEIHIWSGTETGLEDWSIRKRCRWNTQCAWCYSWRRSWSSDPPRFSIRCKTGELIKFGGESEEEEKSEEYSHRYLFLRKFKKSWGYKQLDQKKKASHPHTSYAASSTSEFHETPSIFTFTFFTLLILIPLFLPRSKLHQSLSQSLAGGTHYCNGYGVGT